MDPEFQKLLDKAFLREPSLNDWFDEFKRWEEVDRMIIEALAEEKTPVTKDEADFGDVFA